MVGSVSIVHPHHHCHEPHQDEEAGNPSTRLVSQARPAAPIHRPIPRSPCSIQMMGTRSQAIILFQGVHTYLGLPSHLHAASILDI
uniref:Uncharacterized protein n=1 Tax=Arundo donax TaxID=35708 RepID=A0A0A9CV94_ARUDO